MSNGNGVSRGDRNRNARLSRLRELVPACNAIVDSTLSGRSTAGQRWMTGRIGANHCFPYDDRVSSWGGVARVPWFGDRVGPGHEGATARDL